MAMTFITVEDAIRELAKATGMTNGQNMTPYSDDLFISLLQQAHELVHEEGTWDEMLRTVIRTPDGSTGLVTELITGCTDWKRIRYIYQAGFQPPLPRLSTYVNPLTSSLLLGYQGLAPEDDNPTDAGKYLVRFYPLTTTSQVLFVIENEVDMTNRDTVIPIDFWWTVYTAAWLYVMSDATNPSEISKFEKLMKMRKEQIMSKENARPSFSNPNQLIPNDWWEQDAPYA